MSLRQPSFHIARLATPVGDILVVTDERESILALDFADFEPRMLQRLRRRHGALTPEAMRTSSTPITVQRALEAYFSGHIEALRPLAVKAGGTAFQALVWNELCRTPAGATLSYSQLAAAIGRPSAVRAVGLANGANPVALVVPCHRIIGANGTLTGYAGGLDRKLWLLNHERAHAPSTGLV